MAARDIHFLTLFRERVSCKKHIDKKGVFIFLPGHPLAKKTGWVSESRLVASLTIGRLLRPTEVIQHKDLNIFNNNPDNLIVVTKSNLNKGKDNRASISICDPTPETTN